MKNTIYALLTFLGTWFFVTVRNKNVKMIIALVILGFFIREFTKMFKDICKLLQEEREGR